MLHLEGHHLIERLALSDTAEILVGVTHANTIHTILRQAVVRQLHHLVLHVAPREFRLPRKILLHDIAATDLKVETIEAHLADICLHARKTGRIGHIFRIDQIVGQTIKIVGCHHQTAAEHRQVETGIQLRSHLPLQILIRHHGGVESRITVVEVHVVLAARVIDRNVVVTGLTVAHAKFQVVHNPAGRLHEVLFRDHPAGGHGRKIPPLIAFEEL